MLTNTSNGHVWDGDLVFIVGPIERVVTPYYHQPHRYYHTLEHIEQMYTDAHELFETKLTVEEILAIAYHDIIWFASDDAASVKASASLLKKHHELGILTPVADVLEVEMDSRIFTRIINDAADIVLDTHRHHNTAPDINSSRVIDLDMYGFSQMNRQPRIINQLQLEYGPAFLEGRCAFLQEMLKRKPFYLTLSGQVCKQAYTNILAELSVRMGV